MTTPQQPFQSLRGLPQRLSQHVLQHLSPRQRQYAMLSAPWPAASGCSG
jgi:conjugal transfer pilus assembly protein TraB